MNLREIESLASRFRQAVDEAFECGAFGQEYPFSRFPHECCDDMCDLFGQMLFERDEHVSKVFGKYRYDQWNHNYSHVWLQLEDSTVIDLTGDQYKNDPIMLKYDVPCYVGKPNQLHQIFLNDELQHRSFYGIRNYTNEIVTRRLWNLYDIILSFFKGDMWG